MVSTLAHWAPEFDAVSLSDLSTLSGIALPALSQYKAGVKPMSARTSRRLAVAAAAGSQSVLLRHGLSSFPVMGAVLKRDLAADPSWCLSVLAQGLQQATTHLASDADIEAFHNQPVHISAPGWSALLSAVATLSWQRFKPGKPWWVDLRPLPEPWSPVDQGRYLSQVWKKTPALLQQMNVIIGDGVLKAL